jgi:enolase
MKIEAVSAKSILDSRKEKTIFISIKTNIGSFSASSPTGKSTGKYEENSYKKSLEEDIETIKKFSDYFSDESIEKFDDLRRIEDTLDRHVGANTLFAFESAALKAMAKENKKEVWQIINSKSRKMPRLVGNAVGGGKHQKSQSKGKRKPDFQEFLLIPETNSVKQAFEINKKAKKEIESLLKKTDENFNEKKNDEDAWETSLNEKEIFDILKGLNIPIGVDIAASGFYKRKKYHYENPMLTREKNEQMEYLTNLIKNFNLFYIEDPFEEEDFENFAGLLKKFPNSVIVGDDLTTTNPKRFEKAIKMKSINAIIVKPNQIGSMMKVKNVCEMAKKNNVKIVFSHRSGETEEDILADLAFGFEADFFKCGITGNEREAKIKRLIEIEKKLK